MVAVRSTMLPLGTKAFEFNLPDPSGKMHSLADAGGAKAYCVMFLCNHCPFVKHLQGRLAEIAKVFTERGVAFFGINSNDVDLYPEDSPERMAIEAVAAGYVFPYLYDKTQAVAKLYHAACTPDFFIFNGDQELVYRGQFDDSRPNNGVRLTGSDFEGALVAALEGRVIAESEQKPSVGCNIKWKAGNAPDYFEG